LPFAALLEQSVEADARQFRKARKNDLLGAVREGIEESRFLELYGNFAGLPEYLSFGSGHFEASSAMGPILWSHGVPNPFASESGPRAFALLDGAAAERVCHELPSLTVGERSVQMPVDGDDIKMIPDFCRLATVSKSTGQWLLINWFRNPDNGRVWLQGHLVNLPRIREMLRTRDPEYLVALHKDAHRLALSYSLEHPEKDRHTCEVRKIVGLAPRTSKLVFEEGFEEAAFHLLLRSSGIEFDPGARPRENHTLRKLSSPELGALSAASEGAQSGKIDWRAMAERAGLGDEETSSLTEPEGRLRFLVAEEVGPEVGQFLKKIARKDAAVFLVACV
jgi:hypothetical protein